MSKLRVDVEAVHRFMDGMTSPDSWETGREVGMSCALPGEAVAELGGCIACVRCFTGDQSSWLSGRLPRC